MRPSADAYRLATDRFGANPEPSVSEGLWTESAEAGGMPAHRGRTAVAGCAEYSLSNAHFIETPFQTCGQAAGSLDIWGAS